MELSEQINTDEILSAIEQKYANASVDTTDGVKINFDGEWVHLRKSNTEPIIRIISESNSRVTAENLAKKLVSDIREIVAGQ